MGRSAVRPALGGRTEDLRALAERYAGGPVTEELGPGFSADLISLSTGDGWFTTTTEGLNAETWNGDGWGWTDAAWRRDVLAHPKPETSGPCSAEPGPHIGKAVEEFYERVGVPVELVLPIEHCVGDRATVYVVPLVDGLPLIGMNGATRRRRSTPRARSWRPAAPCCS